MKKIAIIFVLMASLSGCGKSLDQQIVSCNAEATKLTSSVVASNEFQKKELADKYQGIFYQCMKQAGFKEKPDFSSYWMDLLKRNYPNASPSLILEKLNEIRSQSMQRADEPYTLWQK